MDPGTNSSGPGAIHFAGSRLRLVGLDVVQQDALRQPPVVRAHASEANPRSGDTVEINSRDAARVAREMRFASHANPDLSPIAAARTESTRPFIKPAITPQDKARYDRLVAGRVEERRVTPTRATFSDRAPAPRHVDASPKDRARADFDLLAADARYRFASQVVRHLEGGKAAILRPERRDLLVAGAVRDGILPFDANLVIALVQDAARRGDLLTPATINPAATTDQAGVAYDEGIGEYLIAVVSSMRVAALLPLIRFAGPDAAQRPREATAFAQATVAVLLAAMLLVGMIATLGV